MSERAWRSWLASPESFGPGRAIAYMFGYLIAVTVGQISMMLLLGERLPKMDVLGLSFLAGSIFGAVVTVAVLKLRGVIRYAGLVRVEHRTLMIGAAAGILTFGVAILLSFVIDEEVDQDLLKAFAGAGAIGRTALALAAILAVPVMEEILFRGLLFNALLGRVGPGWAIAGSSAAFVIPHALGASFGLLLVLQLMVFAVVVAVIRLRTGSVYPTVVAHSTYNAVVTLSVIASLD